MTQTEQILGYLKRGNSINPMVALRLFKSFRLAARINELRESGHSIERHLIRSREGTRYATYYLRSK